METTLLNAMHMMANHATDLNNSRGCSPSISLTVSVSRYDLHNVTVLLSCNYYDSENYCTVKGSSLEDVMKEVKHRLGFTDSEAMKIGEINDSMKAIAPPDPAIIDNDVVVTLDKAFDELKR